MKTIRRLCVVSMAYPAPGDPIYPFVEQLVQEIADQGVECTVIAPVNPLKRRLMGQSVPPVREVRPTSRRNVVTILRPRWFSVGSRVAGPIRFGMWTQRLFDRAVRKTLRALPKKPDALYAHFLFPSGFSVATLSRETGIPAFAASGESGPGLYSKVPHAYAADCVNRLRGIVAVSEKNRIDLIEGGFLRDPAKARVFPNAVDASVFHPIDRAEAREKLGLAQDAFIAIFVGSFIERKGMHVACRAFDKIGGVSSIFIGGGNVRPDCRGIAFQGKVAHEEIPKYLGAADVFVLPTVAEGCCNAIVEALACGLPVVSSNLPFNDGLLDRTNAIRVDPRSVDAVADAVRTLRDDPALRRRLSEGALRKGRSLEIGARAEAILSYLSENID